MTLKMTEELCQAVAQEKSPRVVDEQTNTAYVLIREDLYERVKPLLVESTLDPEEMAPLIWEVMKEDWEDPAMDIYDNYPPTPPRQ
jgi:hypothetical protein